MTSAHTEDTSSWEKVFLRLEKRFQYLEYLEKSALDPNILVPAWYRDNVQNTLPLLSLLFERLEQEHVVDITEEDFDGHIDDSIQHKIQELEKWNQKWKPLEELASMVATTQGGGKETRK